MMYIDQSAQMMQQLDRDVYLCGDVESSNVAEVCKQILQIQKFDIDAFNKYKQYEILPINLYIQSFGGSIADMWALIDIIESSETPIFTYCTGYCMSAAALIFLAGHFRYMYKHSSLMLHQISVGSFDKINDMEIRQDFFEDQHHQTIKFIKKHTKLGKKFFKRFNNAKEDVYLTAKECLKFGVCDKIIEKSTIRKEIEAQLANPTAEYECECCE